jgi:hypothetical protein
MWGMTSFALAFVLTVAILALAATITSIVSVIGTTIQKSSYNSAAAKIGAWKPFPTDDEVKHRERVRMGVQREEGDPTR